MEILKSIYHLALRDTGNSCVIVSFFCFHFNFFQTFERIDYIKCDIEGHEWEVFQQLTNTINQHRPIIQLEIDPKNEAHLFDFFAQLAYQRYGLNGQICQKENEQHFGGDYLFVPQEKEHLVAQWNA